MAIITDERKARIYFSVSNGALVYKDAQGAKHQVRGLEGTLSKVAERAQQFNDGVTNFVDFTISDAENDYVLSVNKATSPYRSLLLTLASVDDFRGRDLVVQAYLDKSGKYTRFSCKIDHKNLGWLYDNKDWPKAETFKHNGQEFTDTKKQEGFFAYLLEKVIAAAKGEQIAVPADYATLPVKEESVAAGKSEGLAFAPQAAPEIEGDLPEGMTDAEIDQIF